MISKNLSVQEKIWQLLGDYYSSSKDLDKIQQLENRVEILTELLIEVLRELEALRSTEIEKAKAQNIVPKNSIFGKQYRQIALLTHNSSGISGGLEKLFYLWLTEPPKEIQDNRFGRYVKEFMMLKRLGYSDEDIQQYLQEVRYLETLT